MAKVNLIQTNFTAGELSPRMVGRVEVVRYNNGAKKLRNCMVFVHGGAVRRPGLMFAGLVRDSDFRSRLIPYIFSVTQAYQLEFSNGAIRVWTAAGLRIESSPGVPLEIGVPYNDAQIHEIDFVQRGDTMFLFHPEWPIYRVQRFADDDWRVHPAPFTTEPFDEVGDRFTTTLTLSATTVGAGRTFTAAVPVFVAADVGRDIEAGGGIATITGFTSSTVVVGTITYPFRSTVVPSFEWLITGSPQSTVTPSADGPVGTIITLTADIDTWRGTDPGKHVVIDGGLVRITGVTNALVANAEVRTKLGSAVAAIPNSWALCRSMWGSEFGYPRTGAIIQQRLWAAGSPGFPQSAWMSRLADYYDFEIGTEADSAFETRVDSDQANPIRHLAAIRKLIVLSYGAEFTIGAAGDGGIKPGNIDADPQTAFGCNEAAPVRAGSELLFANQSGRKIRALSPDRFNTDQFASPDIAVLAEHITESGVVDMDHQADPESFVFAVLANGQFAVCTLDRDNDVVAWTSHDTDGFIESVSVIPYNKTQVVWATVKRIIDGAEQRSVEIFTWDLYMDCALRVTDPTPFDTLSGLDHLEGKTVVVRADGITQADKVVVGGSISLGRDANSVDVGLPFVPEVELMTPEVASPSGSSQGLQMRTNKVTLLVSETIGARVNGRDVPFRNYGANVLDVPPEPYTGPKGVELLGWERGTSDITITQPRPEPFHLLAVIREFEANL
ncbi:hypothetical protein [Lysobacter sp. ESA13C]|uniref:hypothetical protein n=1 Tax=Lysobacter sp. ESA13C TaxID=2862676 RepID=UPI001CC0374C|nr:hypothetical protein [Lysobacter sp. ESA13C]